MRLYNTRTHKVEPFTPLSGDRVRIYVCGLTPSAEAHLGHARSFIFFDVLRRYLVDLGYRVTFVQNVTDIDDRSIEAARESGRDWREIVNGYFSSFKRSMRRLHVLEPDHEPRATEFVPQILEMIGKLIAAGNAYVVGDGIYFRVKSFPRYGALSGRKVDELIVGARIAPGEEKEDPLDFALWKFAKPGEPSWPSPWGAGRPGWHIECSAMSHVLLGEPFDIHGGGFDLVFPHHENEVAQTESLVPPPMANFWVHGGLLQFDNRKMSKSLGNFEPLYELLDRHDAQAIRFLFLQTGYRKPMNFTEDSIDGATAGLHRLLNAYDALRHAGAPRDGAGTSGEADGTIEGYDRRFRAALDDDMNTSGAVSVLFDLASATQSLIDAGLASRAAGFLHEAMELLGISPAERTLKPVVLPTTVTTVGVEDSEHSQPLDIEAPVNAHELLPVNTVERLREEFGDHESFKAGPVEAVNALIAMRQRAKLRKDFGMADKFRGALRNLGIAVTDVGKDKVSWTVVGG